MRKLLFLFALIILASCGEKKTTHLHFKTELTTLNEQVLEMREQIESGGMDLYSNGEDTRVEMDLSGTVLTSIYNKSLDKLNLLMQAPYASIAMQPDTEEMTQIKQMQDLSEYTVKVLDEVIEIQSFSRMADSIKKDRTIEKENLNLDLPILFKPMGSTKPEMNFIISDADFVDWLTEAMGGFALPPILKEFRKDKEYLFMGVDFSKDTFRMVANEITVGLKGGITLLDKEELTKKEDKFIKTHNLENLNLSISEFINSHV